MGRREAGKWHFGRDRRRAPPPHKDVVLSRIFSVDTKQNPQPVMYIVIEHHSKRNRQHPSMSSDVVSYSIIKDLIATQLRIFVKLNNPW